MGEIGVEIYKFSMTFKFLAKLILMEIKLF